MTTVPTSAASLAAARVLVIGVGALGAPAARVLAEAGVGTLGLVDPDVVEVSNLHRQLLYDETDVGRPKVDVAARRLRALVPGLRVEAESRVLNRERLPHSAPGVGQQREEGPQRPCHGPT